MLNTAVATKRVVGYARVSTDQQAGEDRNSLPVQEQRIRAYAKAHGYEFVRMYFDVQRGGKDNRPQYQAMLAAARAGEVDLIVFRWLDRLGRKAKEILRRIWELQELGVEVIATDEDLQQQLMLLIKAGMAEEESTRNGERVRLNMKRSVMNGVHVGPRPYGYERRFDETGKFKGWAQVPEEAEVIREIWRKLVQENKGFRRVGRELTLEGHRTRHGKEWSGAAVRLVAINPALVGTLEYGKTSKFAATEAVMRVPDVFPAILSPTEWQQLQQRLSIRNEVVRGRSAPSTFLLSGILRCAECGGPMHGHIMQKKDGRKYEYYVCARKEKKLFECPGPMKHHRAREVETAVIDFIGQYTDEQKVAALVAKGADTASVTALEKQLASAERKLADLDADFAKNLALLKKGVLDEDDFKAANALRKQDRALAEAQRADASARLEAAAKRQAGVGQVPERVRNFLQAMQSAPIPIAKAQLQTLLHTVRIQPSGVLAMEFRH